MKDNHKRNRLHQKNLTIYELENGVDIVIYCLSILWLSFTFTKQKYISTCVKPSFIIYKVNFLRYVC